MVELDLTLRRFITNMCLLITNIIVPFLNLGERWKQAIDEKKVIKFVKGIYRCNNLSHQRLSFQFPHIKLYSLRINHANVKKRTVNSLKVKHTVVNLLHRLLLAWTAWLIASILLGQWQPIAPLLLCTPPRSVDVFSAEPCLSESPKLLKRCQEHA